MLLNGSYFETYHEKLESLVHSKWISNFEKRYKNRIVSLIGEPDNADDAAVAAYMVIPRKMLEEYNAFRMLNINQAG